MVQHVVAVLGHFLGRGYGWACVILTNHACQMAHALLL
jgi:hypothetical protein